MARWQFRPPIERTKQGFRINVDEREREVVRHLLEEILYAAVITGETGVPARIRYEPVFNSEHAECVCAQADFYGRVDDLDRIETVAFLGRAVLARPTTGGAHG